MVRQARQNLGFFYADASLVRLKGGRRVAGGSLHWGQKPSSEGEGSKREAVGPNGREGKAERGGTDC